MHCKLRIRSAWKLLERNDQIRVPFLPAGLALRSGPITRARTHPWSQIGPITTRQGIWQIDSKQILEVSNKRFRGCLRELLQQHTKGAFHSPLFFSKGVDLKDLTIQHIFMVLHLNHQIRDTTECEIYKARLACWTFFLNPWLFSCVRTCKCLDL